VKIAPDTNLLVRAAMGDDAAQAKAAQQALKDAALVGVSMAAVCEFAWVLGRGYKVSNAEVAVAIRALIAAENVVVNRFAVEAGLAMLDAGGDFADGVIAYEGEQLGGATFVSFDKRAVKFLGSQGKAAKLLS
jgi:predicted nucleic-acid-binding protein